MRVNAGMVKDTITGTIKGGQKFCYEEAVKTLNSLQTNATVLQEIRKRGKSPHSVQVKNLEATSKYLERTGISLKKLDELSVIHVAGTKGKGSTCAFCESILRNHGFKTGFYSSPHLVAVRERIRINGRPLSQTEFTKHFWNVYDTLYEKKEDKDDMPPYFKFLTVMAFNVFISEKVDVAIIEVGIGGEYDCTNILRQVPVVGITSLGIDHVNVLGHTIEEIAWQKAGIMKPGAIAFTTDGQPKEALQVLQDRACEKECQLYIAPPLKSYDWDNVSLELGNSITNQMLNASLAIQLSTTWMALRKKDIKQDECLEIIPYNVPVIQENNAHIKTAAPFPITSKIATAVQSCSWPGRTQVVEKDGIYFFLDGAHTEESMNMCAKWYNEASQELAFNYPVCRILIFNATGDRDISLLLKQLMYCSFNYVIFCPNIASKDVGISSDQVNFMVTTQQMMGRCIKNEHIWKSLINTPDSGNQIKNENILQLPCVSDVLDYINRLVTEKGNKDIKYHVLTTGSLHLVGCVLGIIDPELTAVNHHLPLKSK